MTRSPLVEFEPPDQIPEESVTRLKTRIAFAREIERSANQVLTDLKMKLLDNFRGVFPVRSTVHQDLDDHAMRLMMRRFDERHPNHDPFPYLLRSGVGFHQRDPTFPKLLEGLKIDEAEEDVRQHPSEYDPRCRFLGDSHGLPWSPLAAADESVHPEIMTVREQIKQWAVDNHLVTPDDCFCAIAFSTLQEWSSDEFDGTWTLSGSDWTPVPFPIPNCPLEGFSEKYRPDLINRSWYL